MKCFINKIFALCLLPFAMSFALACPLCKESLTAGMAKGFFWSILLMLAVPVVVVGTIAGVVWRAGKKQGDHPDVHPE
jgi:heme/copper-type cytochrome/quinol oxidase subunit 2